MKHYLALSLVLISGLTAENCYPDNQDYRDDCCEPCCISQPRKCIDCECYNPPYYMLQCDWGISFEVDFLYWFARENNMPYALEFTSQFWNPSSPTDPSGHLNVLFDPSNPKHLDTKWSPGVRVALGWNTNCDGLDFNLNWTWFKNTKTNTASVSPTFNTTNDMLNFPDVGTSALIDPWINSAAVVVFNSESNNNGTNPFTFDQVKAKWHELFNQIDLEVGRKTWIGRHFTVRPFVAVRGGWEDTDFKTHASSNRSGSGFNIVTSFTDSYKNRFWGVGLVGGLQPSIYFGCNNNFSLFGNIDGSLIYGKFHSKKNENYLFAVNSLNLMDSSNTYENSFYQVVPILDLSLGFGWEKFWCEDRYRSLFGVGWEQHIWFDLNQRIITEAGTYATDGSNLRTYTFQSYDAITTNLYFGGLVVRASFDF